MKVFKLKDAMKKFKVILLICTNFLSMLKNNEIRTAPERMKQEKRISIKLKIINLEIFNLF